MTIITRISRFIKADVHAVLDYLEEPDVLLRQSVREMEAELAATSCRIGEATKQLSQLEQRIIQLRAGLSESESELALCLSHSNDDLARSILRKKLITEKKLNQVLQEKGLLQTELKEWQQQQDSQRRAFECIKQQAEQIAQTNLTTPTRLSESEWAVSEADIEVALLKAKSKEANQ